MLICNVNGQDEAECITNNVYFALNINVFIESWPGLHECVVVTLLTVCVALLAIVSLTLTNYRWYDIYTTV